MGKFININTKIPPLPRRLRPGFYGLTVIFYDTPKRNTHIPEQRSWGSRYRIATKTVARRTINNIARGCARGSRVWERGPTPLRRHSLFQGVRSSYIPGACVILIPLVIPYRSKFTLYWLWFLSHLQGVH